jgi:hypothetical protein
MSKALKVLLLIKSGGVGILATLTAIRQPSRRTHGLNLNQYSTSELQHLQKSIRIRSNYFL